MASVFPPSTYAQCSTCSRRTAAVVAHAVRIAGRVVTWQSCFACNQADEQRWQEQRADEERERLQAQGRAAKAAERDAARVERQRADKNKEPAA